MSSTLILSSLSRAKAKDAPKPFNWQLKKESNRNNGIAEVAKEIVQAGVEIDLVKSEGECLPVTWLAIQTGTRWLNLNIVPIGLRQVALQVAEQESSGTV
jgi:hypothetical protein